MPEQMNKLLNKQVGDDCVFVQTAWALVHVCACGQVNEGGMMEETK